MARYIDADKLYEYIGAKENCKHCSFVDNDIECRSHSLSRQDMCNIIEDLCEESEVVHCKDCKKFERNGRKNFGNCSYHQALAYLSDFCSWGELK